MRQYHAGITLGIIILNVILLLPALKLPFSLIDDSQFSLKARAITENPVNFWTGFPGIREGRLAPVFWAYFVGRFWIAGNNPLLHHLIHSGLIILITGLLMRLVYTNTKSWGVVIWVSTCWLLLSPGWESWYRLSTQEPIQCLFLLMFWLTAYKKSVWPILFGTGLILSKETSIMLLALIVFLERDNKQVRRNGLILAGIAGMYAAVLGWITSHASWSAANAGVKYIINSTLIYGQILWRLWIPQIAILGIFFRPKNKFAWTGLLLAIIVLISLLPWKYPLLRLLMTSKLGAAIFLGVTFSEIFKERKWLWMVIFGLVAIKALYVNYLEIDSLQNNYLAREVSNGKFLAYAAQLPPKSQITIAVNKNNVDAQEWIERIPEYLSVFYNRPDIKINFWGEKADYYAYWSEYHDVNEKIFNKEIVDIQEVSRPISVSLKNLVLHPGRARTEEVYFWKLFKETDLPGESLRSNEETGF